MKASELRIGNYVEFNDRINTISTLCDNEYCKIKGEYGGETVSAVKTEFISEIELTEEILLKFGAKKINPKVGVSSCYVIAGLKFDVSYDGNVYHAQSKKFIPYVHKLQNFVYELKNIELTF
jgi:hypothetical protein